MEVVHRRFHPRRVRATSIAIINIYIYDIDR